MIEILKSMFRRKTRTILTIFGMSMPPLISWR